MITFFPQPLKWWVLAVGMICSASAFAQAPTINCPANGAIISDITSNDPQLWNAPTWWDANNQNHDLGDATTVLSITATPHCTSGTNLHFRYILSLDLDQNDIPETFIDSDSLPDNNKVYFGNSLNQPFSGTAAHFDQRPVTTAEKWGFSIAVTIDSTGYQAKVIWENTLLQSVTPQLPYGNHHILWIVTDDCGQSATCSFMCVVKDIQPPDITCESGLSVFLQNFSGGSVQLWNSDLFQSISDNYTSASNLQVSIRKQGTGTGFPVQPNGAPITSVSYNCCELGIQYIEVWVMDKGGNVKSCLADVLIQDVAGSCFCNNLLLQGFLKNENGGGILNSIFEVTDSSGMLSSFFYQNSTDTTGFYYQILNNAAFLDPNTKISPGLNLDPLNGVNTWDLVLMSQHILGQNPLPTPYKLIAADINRSGTVTTFDIVELRKLILGTYVAFPNNNSWRFVKSAQIFSQPQNPFADTLQESSVISEYLQSGSVNFIGCKIGDVDGTALPGFWEQGTEDRFYGVSSFLIKDQKVETGQTFTVHVQSPEDLEGVQLTLAAKGLRLNHLIPGPTVDENNFGVFPGENTDDFAPVLTAAFENGPVTFDLEFTALTDGHLRDLLAINSDITPAIGFVKNGNRQDIGLQFIQNNSETAPVLHQNTPNPWAHTTQIPFYLPHAAGVELTISDINGRAVYHTAFDAEKGHHQHTILKNDLPAAGMYYYQLRTGGNTYTKKLSFTF